MFYADYQLIYTDTNANIASLGTVLDGSKDFYFGGYNTTSSNRFDGGQAGYVISNEALDPTSFVMVPEPATMMLLGLGSVISLRRRK